MWFPLSLHPKHVLLASFLEKRSAPSGARAPFRDMGNPQPVLRMMKPISRLDKLYLLLKGAGNSGVSVQLVEHYLGFRCATARASLPIQAFSKCCWLKFSVCEVGAGNRVRLEQRGVEKGKEAVWPHV